MQGTAWIGVFRQIPQDLHDCLIVMTSTGVEIVLQRLVRLERDFLVAVGRLSGTTDQPKVLFLPYDQMTYLSFSKKLSEQEMQDAIGKSGELVASAPPVKAEASPPDQPAEHTVDFPRAAASAAPVEPARVGPAPAAKGSPKMAPPSKSILLARLRERLANEIRSTSS
jgi:hypothetical protein